MTDTLITRRQALRAGAVGIGAVSLAACGASSAAKSSGPVTLNTLTWNDWYVPRTLATVKRKTQASLNITLGSDDASMYVKAQTTGGFDIVAADALWVPYYYHQGLIHAFDLESIPASKQLYSAARDIPIWKVSAGYLGYPRAWSALHIYYNPKFVSPPPTSWDVLLDPKYHGKYIRENQPTDIMAEAGLASGAKQPYNMTPAELSRAKDFLKAAKPAFLALPSQGSGVIRALADESAWFTSENLGTDLLVKQAGGPLVKEATPKEGVVGWIDAAQKMKSTNANRFEQVINVWQDASVILPVFQANKEAWFNEKAYKMLINQGQKEVADALHYNEPELALKAHLKGPAKAVNAYISAFNEVMGA